MLKQFPDPKWNSAPARSPIPTENGLEHLPFVSLLIHDIQKPICIYKQTVWIVQCPFVHRFSSFLWGWPIVLLLQYIYRGGNWSDIRSKSHRSSFHPGLGSGRFKMMYQEKVCVCLECSHVFIADTSCHLFIFCICVAEKIRQKTFHHQGGCSSAERKYFEDVVVFLTMSASQNTACNSTLWLSV